MARAKLSPILIELHGSLGDVVFRRGRGGRMMVIKKADMSKVKWTSSQKSARSRFRLAVAFAKRCLADPSSRAALEKRARKLGRTAYHLAISDFFAAGAKP